MGGAKTRTICHQNHDNDSRLYKCAATKEQVKDRMKLPSRPANRQGVVPCETQAADKLLTWLRIPRSQVQCRSPLLPQQSVSAPQGTYRISKTAERVSLQMHSVVSLRNHDSGLSNLDKQVIELLQYKLPERSACKQKHVR